ncbi:hypothetical protein OG896_37210 [Streptomyces sp. NBC_00669]|uniref:hypothetical protein n=1 Tax=Streptomyces sp. NBC_00669 TaxID=2976011 RepID=UPI002E33001D|nr:hypothetical protein [Streptomyces sp. NBC_00669]
MSEQDPFQGRAGNEGGTGEGGTGGTGEGGTRDGGEPASGASIDMVAAALRRDSADLEIYAKVLTGSLADALPAGSVTSERKRTMSDRIAGREGRVERLEVALDDRRLILTLAHGRPQGEVATVVRGVVLSRTPVALDAWAAELAAALAQRAEADARARAALERLVLGD